MVVVEFAYEEMRKLVDMPRDRMVELLSGLGAPSEYEPGVDKIISELTPNRPDWYSMEGLARALKAYNGSERRTYKSRKSSFRVVVDPSVEKVRPYTACAVVKGLQLSDERIRDMVLLQEKLLSTLGRRVKKFGLGLYPLNEIAFPVRYTTMKPGEIRYVPLGHETEMSAVEIIENHKKGQQYGHLIKNFSRYPVFEDAKGRIMALIPIVNSALTGKVDETTEDIFIEVTGTEIHACKAALNILVCTFADMGGEIYEVGMEYPETRFQTPDLGIRAIELTGKEVEKVLGISLGEKEIARLLGKMGFEYRAGKVRIPPYRADILGKIDIIEDIAIAYGYNNFKPTTANFFSPGQRFRKNDDTDAIMRGMGFVETKSFILTNKEKFAMLGAAKGVVEISNPGSVEYTVVRPTLIADMLDTFRMNKMRGLPQKFYEIGIVYDKGKQQKKLIFGIMDGKVDFSLARGFLQSLAKERGFGFELKKKSMDAFEPDYSCAVVSNGKEIGVFGKASEKMLRAMGIEFDIYLCELGL